MGTIRKLLTSTGAKAVGASLLLGVLLLCGYVLYQSTNSAAPDSAYYTMYICTETGKTFRHKNQIGEIQPILSPFSNKNTGIPAEACYWTANGEIKTDPTWVLLNEAVGKPGPTFCPDCGRLVVGHNPRPAAGAKPPPTEDDYRKRRPARSAAERASADGRQ